MNRKSIQNLLTDQRAVSPVLGVALLIAITVILAGVIGFVVLGVNAGNADGPSASLVVEEDSAVDGDYYMVHKGGDTLKSGTVEWRGDFTGSLSNDMATGDQVQIASGATGGEVVRVVWMDPNSDREVLLAEFTLE